MKTVLTTYAIQSEMTEVQSKTDSIVEELVDLQKDLAAIEHDIEHVDEESRKIDRALSALFNRLRNALKLENELRVKKEKELQNEIDKCTLWLCVLSIISVVEFLGIFALFLLR